MPSNRTTQPHGLRYGSTLCTSSELTSQLGLRAKLHGSQLPKANLQKDRYQRNLNLDRLQGSNSCGVSEAKACSVFFLVQNLTACFRPSTESSDSLPFSNKILRAVGSGINTSISWYPYPPSQRVVLYAYTNLEFTRSPVPWRTGSLIYVIKQTEM